MTGARVIPIRPLLGPGDRAERPATLREIERDIRASGIRRLTMRLDGALVHACGERLHRGHVYGTGADLEGALADLLRQPGAAS